MAEEMMRTSLILLACISIAGCAQTPPRQEFCSVVLEPILIDKNDKMTPATLRRVLGINESGELLCAWKKP